LLSQNTNPANWFTFFALILYCSLRQLLWFSCWVGIRVTERCCVAYCIA